MLNRKSRDRALLLEGFKSIPTAALERLASIGVTTLPELRDLWAFGDRDRVRGFLGEEPTRWFESLPLARRVRGGAGAGPVPRNPLSAEGLAPSRHPRGLLTAAPATPAPAPVPLQASTVAAPEREVSLRHRFPPVRDQGRRGTCVAFAGVALFEYHHYPDLPQPSHSEQFLYWGCKERDGVPDGEGTYISTARETLAALGICLAQTWPYDERPLPGNEGHHPPPPEALSEASRYTRNGHRLIEATDVDAMCKALDAGLPVLVGVQTFSNWEFPSVETYGEIPMPLPSEIGDGGHAVLLVGYQVRADAPGGGRFIFRNSWGENWAREGEFGRGYGTFYFDYLRRHGMEALV